MLDANEVYHVPVLLKESVEALAVKPEGTYLDATVGGGGHFREILSRLDKRGTAIGIDRDPDAIEWCRAATGGNAATVILEQCAFSRFGTVLDKHDIGALDGLLLDLGVSSRQIDAANRGFSYMKDAALDMRMDPSADMTAARYCAQASEHELANALATYGEITNPTRMAAAIKKCQATRPLRTSADLVGCLKREYGPALAVKVIAKVFQALRIAVNGELSELAACLDAALSYVKKGGRIVVISYHSLEDRIVKNFFRDNEQACTCPSVFERCRCGKKIMVKRLNKKVIRPSEDEVRKNPRARSARLRAAEKVA
ncbi:MAG TPA: 16S rRNA (cytosine(1402)-N(4))-methyltransferase RsmH [Chitinivibrionales bacterium]|nr:16S rRNA (cytosine(1402)-N(4))-methyltransferase RsmH [Chitinivibrionales bacterium]